MHGWGSWGCHSVPAPGNSSCADFVTGVISDEIHRKAFWMQPLDQNGDGAKLRAVRSAKRGSRSVPAADCQPSAVGPAVSEPTSKENGRGHIPSSCSHGISPPPGCAILSGSRYANFCSKPESLSPLHHHPSQSDGIRLCAWWKNRRVRRWRGSTWFRAVKPADGARVN
jgi:hypothetical protein